MDELALKYPEYFLHVSDEWVRFVHNQLLNPPPPPPPHQHPHHPHPPSPQQQQQQQQQQQRDYAKAYTTLITMWKERTLSTAQRNSMKLGSNPRNAASSSSSTTTTTLGAMNDGGGGGGGGGGSTNTNKTLAEAFFQPLIINSVMSGASNEEKSKFRPDFFPGPMAVQMTRSDLATLKNNDYWITEKSDGVRVMLLNLRVSSFPAWKLRLTPSKIGPASGDGSPAAPFRKFNLFDTCALEAAYRFCKSKEQTATDVHLFINDQLLSSNTQLNLQPRAAQQSLLTYQFNIGNMTLSSSSSSSSSHHPNHQTTTTCWHIVREEGWSFTYLFDRNFTDFYLCLEEFAFLTRQCMSTIERRVPSSSSPPSPPPLVFQRVLLLDGELVFNIQDKRYNYTIYDLVTYSVNSGSTNASSPPSSATVPPISVPHSLRGKSMEERISFIRSHVVDPHHFYHRHYRASEICPPSSLQLVCKHFFRKSQLAEVLSFIRKDSSGEFFYKGYNRNDGLVFTPNAAELYTFQPGTNTNLLKWKWPDKLTSDFLVVPVWSPSSSSPELPSEYALFYWSSGRPVYYRHARICQVPQQVLSDFLKMPYRTNGAIVECGFNCENGEWQIMHMRTDKNSANGYSVITSNLENIVEHIDAVELQQQLLGGNGGETVVPPVDEDDFLEPIRRQQSLQDNLYAHLAVGHSKRGNALYLRYSVSPNPKMDANTYVQKITARQYFPENERCHWNDYIQLAGKKCVGPNGETGNALEEYINTVASSPQASNQNYLCIVRCIFLGKQGVWRIIDCAGNPQLTSAGNLIYRLENLATYTHRITQSKRQQQQPDPTPVQTAETPSDQKKRPASELDESTLLNPKRQRHNDDDDTDNNHDDDDNDE